MGMTLPFREYWRKKSGVDFTIPGILEKKIGRYLSMWEELYGSHPAWQTIGDRFAYVLQQAHRQTGRRCVVLVDEYDKPILHGQKGGLGRSGVFVGGLEPASIA